MKGKIIPEPEPTNPLPAPPVASMGTIKRFSGPGFWFLEVTWTEMPMGLVLGRRTDGLFVRLGFFYMGRNNWEKADWRIRGTQNVGPRD